MHIRTHWMLVGFLESYYKCQAFEMLLNNKEKMRKGFKDSIEHLCDDPTDIKIKFKYTDYDKNLKKYVSKTESNPRSRKVMWADRFFMLRNKIVHGNKVDNLWEFNKQYHFDLANMFFILCIKRILNNTYKKEVFIDKISWDKNNRQFLYNNTKV